VKGSKTRRRPGWRCYHGLVTLVRHHPRRSLLLLVAVAAAAAGVAAGVAFARDAAATRPAAAGVVVIDTNLGYQDGAAAGTGMVLTPSGEVLTNNHVIAGATSIKVVVPATGRTYSATVAGYSVTGDTAVLKLRGASHLTTVELGDSAKLRVGQAVRAVGNAGGTGTLVVAHGSVTGLRRAITVSDEQGGSAHLAGLIETNAGLQPGDSGGPLLDAAGRVVGMDTAASVSLQRFSARTVSSDGYAIPIDRALSLAKQIDAGHSSATVHIGGTAFLGVQIAPSQAGYGLGYGASGAAVAGVVPGSPADRAGLGAGDVITSVAGRTVASPEAIVKLLLQHHPGDRIAIGWTDLYGGAQTATVALASGPPQ
jgi:S1-C subfamily serine protease